MTPEAFINLWPAWVAIAISGLLAFNRLMEESRKFAAFFGEWGRKRHDKAIKRHQIDLQASLFAEAVRAAVEKAREQWEEDENEAIIALRSRLEEVARITGEQALEITQVRITLDKMNQYADYEVQWHKIMRGLANDQELVPSESIPPHMNWWTFERLYDKLGNGKEWWFAEDRDIRAARPDGHSTHKRRGV